MKAGCKSMAHVYTFMLLNVPTIFPATKWKVISTFPSNNYYALLKLLAGGVMMPTSLHG